jgi:predicted Zn-dependent peptidase
MADLSAASVDDVRSFFKTYYAPNNAVLVIAGDIDVPQTKALVRQYFGSIPRGPAVPPLRSTALPAVIGHEQRLVVVDSQAPAPAVFVAYRVPPAKDRRAPVVGLLGDVIGGGQSARLQEALVRRQQIATNIFGGNFGLVDGADMLFFAAIGKPGASPDSLEKALLGELAGASSFTQAELERARASERFNFVDGLQTTGGFSGRADRLAEGWTYYHDANHVNKVLKEFDRVTLADLNELARERIVPANRVTLVFVPVARKVSPTTSSTRVP